MVAVAAGTPTAVAAGTPTWEDSARAYAAAAKTEEGKVFAALGRIPPPSRLLIAVAVVLFLVFCLSRCASATGIQVPLNQYCADSLTAGVYNGVRVGRCPIAPPPSAGCPATVLSNGQALTRLTTSRISYGIYSPTRTADTRNWENIWGHGSTTDNPTLWPGPTSTQPVIRDFGRTTYLAAQFHVPAGFSTAANGRYLHANNPPGPPVTASFSTTCGDFSPQPGTGCVVQQWPDDFSSALFWKSQSTNPSVCPLQPNTDYYLNMKLSDPATTTWCPAGSATCFVYLQNLHN